MINVEELKKRQPEYKKSLQEVIDFINSEEFFKTPSMEKSLINQYRMGLEIIVNTISNLTFGDTFTYDTGNSMILPLLMSTMTSPWGPSKSAEELKAEIEKSEKEKQ